MGTLIVSVLKNGKIVVDLEIQRKKHFILKAKIVQEGNFKGENNCGIVCKFNKLVVIGKSITPRCFKSIKSETLPVHYYYNRKA